MCNISLDRFTLCAHSTTSTTHCPAYLNKPRLKCAKTASESTHFSRCPICRGVEEPKPKRGGPNEPSDSPEGMRTTRSQDQEHKHVPSTTAKGATSKTAGTKPEGLLDLTDLAKEGLRWITKGFRSGTSERRKNRELTTNQPAKASSESKVARSRTGSTPSRNTAESERLAKEYQRIIGSPAKSIFPRSGAEDYHGRVNHEDVETMTTWSQFIPSSDEDVEQRNGGHEGGETRSNVVQVEDKVEGKVSYGLATKFEEEEEEEKTVRDSKSAVASQRFADELERAEERVARVRDGRGYIAFPRPST